MQISFKSNSKTEFTRRCITEAILDLMKTREYEKLHVSDIIRRAGVARMTFYKYYDSPRAALQDYLNMMINDFLNQSLVAKGKETYRTYDHILFALNFFDQYRDFFLIMNKSGMYGILIEGVNRFMEEHISYSGSVYELYSYAGGLLNTFLKWEENGKKEPVEDVAESLFGLFGRKDGRHSIE